MNPISILRRVRARLANRVSGGSGDQAVEKIGTRHLQHYAAAARGAGIDRLYLFLSFDCDTDLDADAAVELHSFLTQRNIKVTYAVPGEQLLRQADIYRSLAREGAEFMNHGAAPHTEWVKDRWVGRTFYNEMSKDDVIADIRRGYEILTDVIGQTPNGFRAPHFGCFKAPEQVELMHRTAFEVGHRYASTTIPDVGLSNGPAYASHGLVEFPCFGSVRYPPTLLDSWTYLSNRVEYALSDEYCDLFVETVDLMLRDGVPGVLTWYGDPCHVLGEKPFIKAMDFLAENSVASVTGTELFQLVEPRLRRSLGLGGAGEQIQNVC